MGTVSFSDPEIVIGGGGGQGNQMAVATLTMSSSYATNGDSINLAELPFDRVINLMYVTPPQSDTALILDVANQKIKAFNGSAAGVHTHNLQFIQDEAVIVAANTGTLTNLPALVQNVEVTAAGAGPLGPYLIVPNGVAPGSGKVSINLITGVLIFNAGDAVTACTSSYARIPTSAAAAGVVSFTEVANATDLSAVSTKVILYGR